MPVRIPVAAVVLAVGLTCGLVAGAVLGTPHGAAPAPTQGPGVPAPGEVSPALAVLRAWDDARAAAWAAGDAAALARLYTARSTARAADVALLRRYRARGFVVRGMRMQLLRARVVAARPRLVVLEVTDRLAAATAVPVSGGAARRLPVDAATTRELVLRRVGDRWLMARVSVRVGGR